MDENYKWLLSQLALTKASFPVVQTGVCRGRVLLNWYCRDAIGRLEIQTSQDFNKTKHLLSHFLHKKAPLLGEHSSNKLVCYLYHKTGVKLLTAKEAGGMAENQLHGLQVRSIHLVPATSHAADCIYQVSAWKEENDLMTEVKYGKFIKETRTVVRESSVGHKVVQLLSSLVEFAKYNLEKLIKKVTLDMVIDISGNPQLIVVSALEFLGNSPALLRTPSEIKLLSIDEESLDISTDQEPASIGPFDFLSGAEQVSRSPKCYKLPLLKREKPPNQIFLDMVAKTIAKQRRQRGPQVSRGVSKRLLQSRRSFQTHSLTSAQSLKHVQSLGDLLHFIEKTRPRIWLKDQRVAD